jgi:hypothetical protein
MPALTWRVVFEDDYAKYASAQTEILRIGKPAVPVLIDALKGACGSPKGWRPGWRFAEILGKMGPMAADALPALEAAAQSHLKGKEAFDKNVAEAIARIKGQAPKAP